MMFWKKNEALSSKLDFVIKENEIKIASISKDLNLFSKKNTTLQNDIDSHVCHASVVSPSRVSIACTSSIIKNDICLLKKNVDYLSSTWANVPWTTHVWNLCFTRNKFLLCMHTNHGIHMLPMFIHTTLCMLMCTLYTLWI